MSAFYGCFFGRDTPATGLLGRIVSRHEREQQQSDFPIDQDTWEALYRRGAWRFLAQLDELSRYSVICGYINYLAPRSAILDIGCGEGVLLDRLGPDGYGRYVGLDLSEAAISRLRSRQNQATRFLRADAETYIPDEIFDVIVFNESLYYLHDPLAVAERYAGSLKPYGIMVVSLFQGSARARAIRALLQRRLALIDETHIKHPPKSWVCGVYRRAGELGPSGLP
jgi:SAM-dependent methyltransferase